MAASGAAVEQFFKLFGITKKIMTKHSISFIAAALLSTSAFAAEVPAVFDAKNCKAEYPKASLLNEEQGAVSMAFLVSPAGEVLDSKVEKSSGFKNLDKAAVKAISACKFKPGTKDGAVAQTWTKVDYVWKL
jgi:periplasmic protein TonB